jgi:digeranylgeranylglycerophospholipid reductase
MDETYDVIIVGAGPAGSSAALAAAQRGVKVLLLDQRQRIGVPIQCAEFVPRWISRAVHFSSTCVVQTIETMITHLPDQSTYEMKSPGYMLDRSLFDKELAASAVQQGAHLSVQSRVTGLTPEGVVIERGQVEPHGHSPWHPTSRPSGATSRPNVGAFIHGHSPWPSAAGGKNFIRSKVVIGADGVRSSVAQWVGGRKRKEIVALQYEVVIPRLLDTVEIFFSKEVEGGYAWFFPKGMTANIGLGTIPQKANILVTLMTGFLDRLADLKGFSGIHVVGKTGGAIPCDKPGQTVFGNVLLVGDAAGHAHPITGAGILNAVIGGEMAGRISAEAVLNENLTHLHNYESEWLEAFGKSLSYGASRRQFMEDNWNNNGLNFEELIRQTWVGFKEYYKDRRNA